MMCSLPLIIFAHASLSDERIFFELYLASAPLRDEWMLESAIMRPRMAVYYGGADIIRRAALLAVGILQDQAFLDGNKRIGFLACDVFLRLNELAFVGDPLELAFQLVAVIERRSDQEEATAVFEE